MKRILILGITGMLGSMLFHYFTNNTNYKIYGTTRNKKNEKENILYFNPNDNDFSIFQKFDFQYIINCIGVIKPCIDEKNPESIKNAYNINSLFPLKLKNIIDSNTIIIQIASDCVFNGKVDYRMKYNEHNIKDAEDVYGKSKILSEHLGNNFIVLRNSIIGPELDKRENKSLFQWIIDQSKNATINGYCNHYWNGITTLQFAKNCKYIIENDYKINVIQHIIPKDSVNKFELLNMICEIFNRNDIIINKIEAEKSINRKLMTLYDSKNNNLWDNKILSIREMLIELRDYMIKYNLLKDNINIKEEKKVLIKKEKEEKIIEKEKNEKLEYMTVFPENPDISIVMPTYNQEKYIEDAIKSFIRQTFKNFELIIINDGSTDKTFSIIEKYAKLDKRIRIYSKINGGTGSALNFGFKCARSRYETWFASDNELYDTALEDMYNFLENNGNIDFVYGNCDIKEMDREGCNILKIKNYSEENDMSWNADKFYERYNIGIVWLWRKKLRINAGEMYILEPCEDYEMTTRMIECNGKFHYINKCLGAHRRHCENLSYKLKQDKSYVRNLIKKMVEKRDKIKMESHSLKNIFTDIYKKNYWGGNESRSGKGSDKKQTNEIISQLPILFSNLDIKKIIDAPCGDLNWMKDVLKMICYEKYLGIDIVDELIENNKNIYYDKRNTFKSLNLINDKINEKADIIICRDCLNHLSFNQIYKILNNFILTDSKYIMLTNFYYDHRNNVDIPENRHGWRHLNFLKEPFNFPEPYRVLIEKCTESDGRGGIYYDKSLAVWRVSDIKKMLIKNKKYESNKIEKTNEWNLIRFPKIAHFYWGNKILPFLRYLTFYSFSKFNPDWEINLYIPKYLSNSITWKSNEQKCEINENCKDYIEELRKLPINIIEFDSEKEINIPNTYPEVFKSDFLRWNLLSKVGGFWFDSDILFFKSMNEFALNNRSNINYDTLVAISYIFYPELTFHTIGFMGSCQNNEYYEYIRKKAHSLKHIDFNNYQSNGSLLLNKEFPIVESISEKFSNLKVLNLPFDSVYMYYPIKLIPEIFSSNGADRTTQNSIGLHYYGGHPNTIKHINLINHENYKEYINTPIGKIINSVFGGGK